MKKSETNKNKYAALATYLFAVVCLLLGMFLPLFNGKEILALQLPDALNAVAGKQILSFGKPFALAGLSVITFGAKGFSLDFFALTVLLYAIVTVFALLALIPVGISVKRETKTSTVFAYIAMVAAVIVTALYFILALAFTSLPATATAPDPLVCYNVLIALGGPLLALIVLACINKKAAGVAKTFLFILGAAGAFALFNVAAIIPAIADFATGAKLSALFYGDNAVSGIAYTHYLFAGGLSEIFSVAPDAKTKAVIALSVALSLIAIINLFIDIIGLSSNAKRTGLIFNISRYSLSLAAAACLLITLAVAKVTIGLMLIVLAAAVLIQLLISVARFLLHARRVKKSREDAIEEEQTVRFEKPVRKPRNEPAHANAERPAPARPPYAQRPAESRQMEITDGLPARVETAAAVEEPPVPRDDGAVQINIAEVQPAVEPEVIVAAEPEIVEIRPVTIEPAQPVIQPETVEVKEELAEPETEVAEEPAPAVAAAEPLSEPEVKETPAPVQTAYEPIQTPAPAPAQTPAPAPVSEPPVEVYRVNKVYGGPVDDFIRKLSNDEQIEFAMTFIEKSKGDLSNLPEYVVGGENKKFFNAVFIYLGRLRGMISDGLLNKMFRELNML